jgi:hypothetical protein
MLSEHEQGTWDEIRRRAEEPAGPVLDPSAPRPRPPGLEGLLAAVVVGSCAAILLVVIGAPLAGLAIAVATAPRWLLWRHRALLGSDGERSGVDAVATRLERLPEATRRAVGGPSCDACRHPVVDHDAIALRFCRATLRAAIVRGCLCRAP